MEDITFRTAAERLFEEFRRKGGKKEDWNTAKKIVDEYLGDKTSDDVQFRFFDIPDEDKFRYYQLLIKYAHFRVNVIEKEDENKVVWKEFIEPCMSRAKLFQIDEELIPALFNTKSQPTNFPFDFMALDCKIPIKDRTYYGLLVGSLITEERSGDVPFKTIVSCYTNLDEGERRIEFEFISFDKRGDALFIEQTKHNSYQKELLNFFYSFCNFLNEPEVKFVTVQTTEKNNQRRREKGRLTFPKETNFIRIYGNLRTYIDQYNAQGKKGFSHKFHVRGHFVHFRNQDKYKRIYSLDTDQIKELGYNMTDGILKKWKKPYIKGQGILINKEYKVKNG